MKPVDQTPPPAPLDAPSDDVLRYYSHLWGYEPHHTELEKALGLCARAALDARAHIKSQAEALDAARGECMEAERERDAAVNALRDVLEATAAIGPPIGTPRMRSALARASEIVALEEK